MVDRNYSVRETLKVLIKHGLVEGDAFKLVKREVTRPDGEVDIIETLQIKHDTSDDDWLTIGSRVVRETRGVVTEEAKRDALEGYARWSGRELDIEKIDDEIPPLM